MSNDTTKRAIAKLTEVALDLREPQAGAQLEHQARKIEQVIEWLTNVALRDQFAGLAIQFYQKEGAGWDSSNAGIAAAAYRLADAMLKERLRPEPDARPRRRLRPEPDIYEPACHTVLSFEGEDYPLEPPPEPPIDEPDITPRVHGSGTGND